MAFSWTCPYCGRHATVTDENREVICEHINAHNKDGDLLITMTVTVCPNPACKEYAISATLHKTQFHTTYLRWSPIGDPLLTWTLRPQSDAKVFPAYIPAPILEDYKEACAIVQLSPKASATLSRRCLQGMIRDFWGVSKPKLFDAIAEINGKVDPLTWDAIDVVRGIGNIGAHMEKDINLVIDVEPQEATLLIGLIELLLGDWYIGRHEREDKLKGIVDLGAAKAAAKKPATAESS